jgi:hypothetical protein
MFIKTENTEGIGCGLPLLCSSESIVHCQKHFANMVAHTLNKSSPIILHPAKQTQRKATPREKQIISMSRSLGGAKTTFINECIQSKVRSLEKTFSKCVL